MSATLNDFIKFDATQSLDREGSIMDSLAETFNGGRMKYSAAIGAAASVSGSSLMATFGGAVNGFMNSNSDDVFGKVTDAIKGVIEAQMIKRIVDLFPENNRALVATVIGGAGFMLGNHMQNIQENNTALIQSQISSNPAVEMMQGYGRDTLLDAARNSAKDNLEHVKDPELKNYYKMT